MLISAPEAIYKKIPRSMFSLREKIRDADKQWISFSPVGVDSNFTEDFHSMGSFFNELSE